MHMLLRTADVHYQRFTQAVAVDSASQALRKPLAVTAQGYGDYLRNMHGCKLPVRALQNWVHHAAPHGASH
jgi:hypothetical protein